MAAKRRPANCRCVASGAPMEALMQNGKVQELFRQIQQDSGDKPSTVPDGGQEVTPHAG